MWKPHGPFGEIFKQTHVESRVKDVNINTPLFGRLEHRQAYCVREEEKGANLKLSIYVWSLMISIFALEWNLR